MAEQSSGYARLRIFGFAIAGVVTALDQATKAIVVANAAALNSGIQVFEGFNLVYRRNPGVTFGLFDQAPWWGLSLLAVAICAGLGVLMLRTKSILEILAYAAIIGGALGNVIDRARNGAVTDFLDFYVGSLHWPTFNLADTFIVVGVGALLLQPLVGSHREGKA